MCISVLLHHFLSPIRGSIPKVGSFFFSTYFVKEKKKDAHLVMKKIIFTFGSFEKQGLKIYYNHAKIVFFLN